MKLRVIISLDTHANNKVIYSTRRKHFVLCVGTALRCKGGNDSNLLIVFYVQIMPDDFVMQLHRF